MSPPAIDFWFTMGSTYSYLSVGRYEAVAHAAGVTIRPRVLRSVLALTGATQLPFVEGTAKMRYMRRDVERRAARRGLPCRAPFPYPAPGVARANVVAVVGLREGWGRDYMREAYRLWFQDGLGNGGDENLRRSLAACGQAAEVERILAAAAAQEVADHLARETEAARDAGVFGAPTFVVGEEVFWGDDRLEDAVDCALHGRLPGPAVPSPSASCQ